MRAIILDFDGLVIDSETPLFELWQEIYRERGQQLTIDSWQHALGTMGGFDPYEDLATRAGIILDREAIARFVKQRHRELCRDQPLLPGVRERLVEARSLGFGTAVASSSTSEWVDPWLAHHGLDALVDTVCTRGDVARVKPAPDLFLLAASRLGVPPDCCLVFEDSPNGLRAAREAGMHAIAVPNRLTRGLPLPEPDLVLASLADLSLREIIARLSRNGW